MDAHIQLKDNFDCLQKWCEKEKSTYEMTGEYLSYSVVHFNIAGKRGFTAEADPDPFWHSFGIYVNHSICTELCHEEEFFDFSLLVNFICKTTDSDMLVFFEGGIPLLLRKNGKIWAGEQYFDVDYQDIYVPLGKMFKGLEYEIADIDKMFDEKKCITKVYYKGKCLYKRDGWL